jgi:hypothetical protein
VYRSTEHLPFDSTRPGITIDPVPGVVDFDDPELHRLHSDQVVAWHHRLGNTTTITELRKEVAAITGSPVPFVNAKILYSETHSGDYIEVSQLDTLAREWAVLSAGMKPGTRWAPAFVRQLRELIAVAWRFRPTCWHRNRSRLRRCRLPIRPCSGTPSTSHDVACLPNAWISCCTGSTPPRRRTMRTDSLSASKVTAAPRAKLAYVYIRQSSPMQVIRHAESTDLQYQLVE